MRGHPITRRSGENIAQHLNDAYYQPPPKQPRRGKPGGGQPPETRLFKTPTGGITAATGSGTSIDPYVWGEGDCTVLDVDSGVETTTVVTIYNLVKKTIDGDVPIKASKIGDRLFVDVADCKETT